MSRITVEGTISITPSGRIDASAFECEGMSFADLERVILDRVKNAATVEPIYGENAPNASGGAVGYRSRTPEA